MITEPITLCRACGRIRGDLSYLCVECLKLEVQKEIAWQEREQNRTEYRREDAESRERAKNSDGMYYHD